MYKEKRGLSEIVTTILIVLLAITALVVIWQLILPMLTRVNPATLADCPRVMLEIKSATVASGTVTVFRQATTGKPVKVIGVGVTWLDANGAVVTSKVDVKELKDLETNTFTTGAAATGAKKVSVYPILGDGTAEGMTCGNQVASKDI